jgi:hypothetical protein
MREKINKAYNRVKEKLMSLICDMSLSPAPRVKNPDKDFTRNRKLSFNIVVKLSILVGLSLCTGVRFAAVFA